ncbi:hypothetical protein TEA_011862 [Camellia sinensis var. sinensis]|uniref:Leucine-rich repeat-containing N-terminal plant-type domain-containing protein n=1 Tax=Camellia sinensis var. sinensis TaxID=542762 RepID=A0A4S4DXC0_CAMSN|nr:hypothetical protein TEA_011862 [Camellia sinensis var. sinensis]
MGNGINETDQLALLALKSQITDDLFKLFTSWNDSVHFCQWNGVTCGRRHHQRVVLLDLWSLKLSGNISPYIENDLIGGVPTMEKLHKLHRLSIASNHLGSGHIVDLGFLPSLNNATGLVLLDLGDNNFGGMLTETIGNLSTKLRKIQLGYNQILGSIPYGIQNLINLERIWLVGNHFTGNLPFDIGKLQNLQDLDLSENEFREISHPL